MRNFLKLKSVLFFLLVEVCSWIVFTNYIDAALTEEELIARDSVENYWRCVYEIKKGEENKEFYKHCAYSLLKMGYLGAALEEYDKILKKYPNKPDVIREVYIYKIMAYRQAKRYEAAIDFATTEAAKYRNDTRPISEHSFAKPLCLELESLCLRWIARLYTDWGKYDKALEQLEKEKELYTIPDRPQDLGWRAKDKKICERVINLTIPIEIGHVYKKWGKYKEAITQYQKALSYLKSRVLTEEELKGRMKDSLEKLRDKDLPNWIAECEAKLEK